MNHTQSNDSRIAFQSKMAKMRADRMKKKNVQLITEYMDKRFGKCNITYNTIRNKA